MGAMDNMGLGAMAKYFRETEPWASDPPEVRKNFIIAVRKEQEGDHEAAERFLDKAIAAA